MRWNESATVEFVKIYLKHECLWNPKKLGYKVKYLRDKAYSEICREFQSIKNLTVPEVKIKIKTLRTTYIQQVHKILEKSSPDCVYEPSLVWFQDMDQCLKHVISRNRQPSYPQETPEVDSSSQIWLNLEGQNTLEEDYHPDPLVANSDDDFDSDLTKTESSTQIKIESTSPLISSRKIKKKKLRNRSHTVKNKDFLSESGRQEDEFDIYGKYIASQLRKMNLQRALRLQLEIQNLVSEARISDIASD